MGSSAQEPSSLVWPLLWLWLRLLLAGTVVKMLLERPKLLLLTSPKPLLLNRPKPLLEAPAVLQLAPVLLDAC